MRMENYKNRVNDININILILLFAVLSFAAYGCNRSGEDERFDFRNTHWGMSQEKVKASEATPPGDVRPEVITYSGEFEGRPAIVGYLFDDGKLVRAGYLMTESYDTPEAYVENFNSLRDYYTQAYGRPSYDALSWKEGASQAMGPGKFPEAACKGDLQYLAGWGTHGSMVRLKLQGAGGKCELGVMYESKHLYVIPEMEEKEWEKYRKNMKRGGAEER